MLLFLESAYRVQKEGNWLQVLEADTQAEMDQSPPDGRQAAAGILTGLVGPLRTG